MVSQLKLLHICLFSIMSKSLMWPSRHPRRILVVSCGLHAGWVQVWHAYAKWHREGGGSGPAACFTILGRGRKVIPHLLPIRWGSSGKCHEHVCFLTGTCCCWWLPCCSSALDTCRLFGLYLPCSRQIPIVLYSLPSTRVGHQLQAD